MDKNNTLHLPKSSKNPVVEIKDPELVKRYDRQTNFIIGILVVALTTMIIMTATLLVDSFHFNSTTYKEYSTKMETQNNLLEINKLLLESNKQNQELIQKRLTTIEDLIKNRQ